MRHRTVRALVFTVFACLVAIMTWQFSKLAVNVPNPDLGDVEPSLGLRDERSGRSLDVVSGAGQADARSSLAHDFSPQREPSKPPAVLPRAPAGSFRLVDQAGHALGRRRLEFWVEDALRFTLASNKQGLVSLAAVAPEVYQLRSPDEDLALIAWKKYSASGRKQGGGLTAFTEIEVEVGNTGKELFDAELLATPLAAVAFRVLGDSLLSSKFHRAQRAQWLPQRLRAKVRAASSIFAQRWPQASICIYVPTRAIEVEPALEVELLLAHMGIMRHSFPVHSLSALRQEQILRLEPRPEQRAARLRIDVLGPASAALSRVFVSLACLELEFPWFPVPCCQDLDILAGRYFVYANDPLLKPFLRKAIPGPIDLRVGQPVRRVIELPWRVEAVELDVKPGARLRLWVADKLVALYEQQGRNRSPVLIPCGVRLHWRRGAKSLTTAAMSHYGGRLRLRF